jgi:hypothetical protein
VEPTFASRSRSKLGKDKSGLPFGSLSEAGTKFASLGLNMPQCEKIAGFVEVL